ncbi:MAG: adenylate/guanylate cyclase domain-containing protein [Bradyrhizobium sp.]|nr:adenylate/guanylate cyclase domain-containing protein [Bradyrhizobium sp.]
MLAADVAGYSRLMGVDEEGTLARLKAIRKTLVDPTIAANRGRIVKTTGDGVLVEFVSAVDAARCSVEVQRGMAAQNADVPRDFRIELRIGIHIGDIIIDDNDIFGDGVNIAARLEGVAEPGGVCISDDAQRQIRGKVDMTFDDIGPKNLKNIAEPVRAWRLRLNGDGTKVLIKSRSESVSPLALPDKPSIAVLAFQNMSGDPDQEYFADGIVEDIITALARMPWFFVVARNSSFTYKSRAVDLKQVGRDLGVRYILEGSVRSAGNRVRVTGQLIDAITGTHLWAERFDGNLKDVFDLQDQITSSIVAALTPKLEQAEIERAKRKPTESLTAYDFYMRGLTCFHRGSRQSLIDALQLFDRAIELDPGFASAYGMASWCCIIRNNNGWLPDTEVERLTLLARKAGRLGKDDPIALGVSGVVLAQIEGDLAAGSALLDRALMLGPSLAAVWHLSGWVRLYLGQAKNAIEHMKRALRLNPLDPLRYAEQSGLAAAYFLDRQYGKASTWADRALHEQPNYTAAIRMAAASCALAGQTAKAKSHMARMLEIDPSLRTSRLTGIVPFRGNDDAARYVDGLRRAGLPD